MNSAEALMRVLALRDFAGPDRFEVEHRRRPTPGPTEVLVAVTATGINPVEWGASAGGWLATLHGGPPLYLGWDVAGRVVDVGYGVTRLKPGDEVFGMPRFPYPAGSYGEYVTAPSRHFALKPSGISHIEAAGLPLVGLTAWQALVDTAGVRAGHRVLVTAAAGGVEHIAVQIAKGAWTISHRCWHPAVYWYRSPARYRQQWLRPPASGGLTRWSSSWNPTWVVYRR